MVDVCVVDEDRINKWKYAIDNYKKGLAILLKRDSQWYEDSEIENFQQYMDNYFQLWMQLHSQAGCTNYIHLLGSSHAIEYMRYWGTLSKFSNQGWESLNAMLKRLFFNRTNKGGGKKRNDEEYNRISAIGQNFQRRLMWCSGKATKEKVFPERYGVHNQEYIDMVTRNTNSLENDEEDIGF